MEESVVLVFAITVHVVPPSVEFSHCVTLPTFPANVSVPLPLEQADNEGKVPPTDVGLTEITTGFLLELLQPVALILASA